MSGLDLLRTRVLGPIAASAAGHDPQGVRRFEQRCPELVDRMHATIAGHDAGACVRALVAAIDLYRHERETTAPADLVRGEAAEREVTDFLETTSTHHLDPR